MKRTINAINDVASILGFRSANGTDTGARGFSVLDGFGRVQFVSFKVMCRLCACITDVEYRNFGKTYRTPHFDYHVSIDGNLLVVFKNGLSLFFDKENLEQAVFVAGSVPYHMYIELQYAKKKNGHRGSYIKWSHFLSGYGVVMVSPSKK
ncbi:hypothetical protein F485_gp116 [Aeromonas phage CC2]|uniref:Uncharacterized protein n=1 Tax=Aeromonas phage CC2 TaxID=1204516 RepID=I6X7J5_9CAUD|nr:hypothetical protein F485_gp116 [Aeromonas phage CC2]AFN39372.1 hypothetical protein CC2_187 [Aeromonas phage CC2]